MYRLVAVDMDGTLLDSNGELPQANCMAVKHAQQLGVKVVPFTARTFAAVQPYAQEMQLRDAVVCLNGALVQSPQEGSVLHADLLLPPLPDKVLKLCVARGFTPMIFDGERVLSEPAVETQYTKLFQRIMKIQIEQVKGLHSQLCGKPIGKIQVMGEPAKLAALQKEISARWGGSLQALLSTNFALEITAGGKGRALRNLATHWNIPLTQVVAIGDGESDIPMLELASLGIAMGNAPDAVKKQATYTVPSNDNNGVAFAFEHYIIKTLCSKAGEVQ